MSTIRTAFIEALAEKLETRLPEVRGILLSIASDPTVEPSVRAEARELLNSQASQGKKRGA